MPETEAFTSNDRSKELFTPTQELKMALFSQGISPTDRARISIQGTEGKPLTTGDYVSTDGVIIKVGKYTTINVPFPDNNPFAKDTPYVLDFFDEKFWIKSGNNKPVEVEHISPPAYLDEKHPSGIRYGDIVATHTDRARISPIQGCALDCHFCNVPNEAKYHKVDKEALVDAVQKAIEDPIRPAQHLLISGGTPGPRDFPYLNEVYETVTGLFPGLDIDVMMAPAYSKDKKELLDPKRLKKMGIRGLSINLELYNPAYSEKYMGLKYHIGRDRYLSFLEKAVNEFGVGPVRSMLMVGLEPIEDTLRGVEELAKRGVCPELSPFRPDPSLKLQDVTVPPSVETQKRVYEGTQEIIDKYRTQYPTLTDGLQCTDCMHNVLMFPGKNSYLSHYDPKTQTTIYEYPLR